MRPHLSALIQAYEDWIEQMRDDGRSIWRGTIQFNHLGRSKAPRIEIMQQEVGRIYCLLLTNLFRNPRKMEIADLPILISSPDSPVSKNKPTTRLAEMLPNDGMHYHFILAVPAVTRLKVALDLHVKQKMTVYLGKERKVSKFDLQQLINGERIADYNFKHIKRGTYTLDDILILPAGAGEQRKTARATHKHPMPDELRAGFRRLLAVYQPMLLVGEIIKMRSQGSVGPAVLTILPHAVAGVSAKQQRKARETGKLRLKTELFTLSSATLIVRDAGRQTTAVGKPNLVLRELEAIFNELVVRDPQFQTTPKFAAIATSLAPLVHGEYSVKVRRPKPVRSERIRFFCSLDASSADSKLTRNR
jgi:hypothetical protein